MFKESLQAVETQVKVSINYLYISLRYCCKYFNHSMPNLLYILSFFNL